MDKEKTQSIEEAAVKHIKGVLVEAGMEAMTKKVYEKMGTAATIFGHPRSEFGLFLMGVRIGLKLGQKTGPAKEGISTLCALPGLMSLLAWFKDDRRSFEMYCPNQDEAVAMTEAAERMLELYHKKEEDSEKKER